MDTEAYTFAYTRNPTPCQTLTKPEVVRYMQRPGALRRCPNTILWGKEALKVPLSLFCVDHLLLGVGPTLNSEFLQ